MDFYRQAVEVIRVVPAASDVEVRRKALQLAVALTTERTATNFVELLKRELRRVQRSSHHQADTAAASDAVLSALQSCLAAFPHTVPGVITCVSFSFFILLLAYLHLCEPVRIENLISFFWSFQLAELVSSESDTVSLSALRILRETLVRFPEHAPTAVDLVLQHFPLIRNAGPLRQATWLLGEFCSSADQINEFIDLVTRSLGEVSGLEK